MGDRGAAAPAGAVNPGLCGSCENVRIVETRRGSRFYLCRLSDVDPRFPKYPRLPVLRCAGYVRDRVTPPATGPDDDRSDRSDGGKR